MTKANQISSTLQSSISRLEERLSLAQNELDSLSRLESLKEFELDDSQASSDVEEEFVEPDQAGIAEGRQTECSRWLTLAKKKDKQAKNKFTGEKLEANQTEEVKTKETEIVEREVDELFFGLERRLGINSTAQEMKLTVQRLIQGDELVFMKAHFGSNHWLVYSALSSAKKRIAILFLNPSLALSMKQILPKNIDIITLDGIDRLQDIDILAVEQCEVLEDLLPSEQRKLQQALQNLKCSKLLVAGFMTLRVFLKLKVLAAKPFRGYLLAGLNVIRS